MNKKTILFASLLLGGLPLVGTLSAEAAVRDTISINQGWQFHRGDVKNIAELKSTQSGDDVANLPHDFLIGQDWVAPDASERPDNSDAGSNVRSRLSSRGFKEMGIGWYRYELTPKDEWKGKRIVLAFQGIMLVGDVYLNGQRIGGTDYGYLGFDIDLSKLLKWDSLMKSQSRRIRKIQVTPAGLRVPVSIVMSISSSPIRICSSLAIRSLSVHRVTGR